MVRPIDLRRLHVLRMVREHGTVTAAAEALHLTPSAVSHQVRQLARELGVVLLERDGRRVRLTPAGQRVVEHADVLLAGWEAVTADLAAFAEGQVGTLRMCASNTAVAGIVAPAIERLRATTPSLEVRVAEVDDATEGFRRLLRGDADIALVTPQPEGAPIDDARYDQQPLISEPFDLLVPHGHRLASRSSVGLQEAAREPWILPAADSSESRHLVDAACATAGFSPRSAHQASSPLAVAALVSAGLGVALVPRLAPLPAHHAADRVPVEGDPPPQRQIATCVRRGSAAHPAIAQALQVLREVTAELPPPLVPVSDAATPHHGAERRPHRHAG